MLEPLNELAKSVHANARDKGWWDNPRPFTDVIALIHCELSEALEEYREGHSYTEIYGKHEGGEACSPPCHQDMKPEGVPIELADAILRILDFCGSAGVDIEEALRLKMAYNVNRPHRHGGKLA